jgi:hypothetical protein
MKHFGFKHQRGNKQNSVVALIKVKVNRLSISGRSLQD